MRRPIRAASSIFWVALPTAQRAQLTLLSRIVFPQPGRRFSVRGTTGAAISGDVCLATDSAIGATARRRIAAVSEMLDVCHKSTKVDDEETALIFRKAVVGPLARLAQVDYFDQAELKLLSNAKKTATGTQTKRTRATRK